jgi:hypothetical protein
LWLTELLVERREGFGDGGREFFSYRTACAVPL